jgi:hypothetical protein
VNYQQRVRAEREWLGKAVAWACEHPGATVQTVIAAVPNPRKLLVRPLAGAAVEAAAQAAELAADAKARTALGERRRAYEDAGVRIWHDAGGWHARWPVRDGATHTGISHPDNVGRLLDRLDALEGKKRGRG